MKDSVMIKNAEGAWEIKLPEPEPVAHLEATFGALDKFAGTEIMGIPIGGAAIGVGLAAALNSLAAKFLPGQTAFLTKPVGKVVLAWAVKNYMGKFVGHKSADAIAFVLVADAARGYIEPMITKLIGGTASLSQTLHGAAGGNGNKITSIAEFNAVYGIN